MSEDLEAKKGLNEESEEIKAQTAVQMQRARLNDYVAIFLAVGTVIFLWVLQWMGLY